MKIHKLSFFIILILSFYSISAKTSIASGNWSNAAIWSPAGVPVSSDAIIISSGNTVTLTSNVIVRNINIKSGAILNGGNFRMEFNIWGILVYTNNGIHNATVGSTALYFNNNGAGNIDGNGVLNGNIEIKTGGPQFLATCNLTINGDLINSPLVSANTCSGGNAGNIIINGNIELFCPNWFFQNSGSINQIGAGNSTTMYHGFSLYNTGVFNTVGDVNILNPLGGSCCTTSFYNLGSSLIEGDLRGTNNIGGKSRFLNFTNSFAKFKGAVFPPGFDGEFATYFTGNTVEYNGVNQVIKQPASSFPHSIDNLYYHLIISNTGTKTLENSVTVKGNLTIRNAAQLDVTLNNYNIILGGNWTDSSTVVDPFLERAATIFLQGTTPQTISSILLGGETYNNLVVNNLAGITQILNNINISNVLTFTNGVVHTGIYETYVTNSLTTAITGYTNNSYLDGSLRRNLLSSGGNYYFPVGNSNAYELAIVNLLGTHTIGNLLVNFSNLSAGSGLPLTEGVTYSTILNCGGIAPGSGNTNDGVWTITPNIGTANYDLALYAMNYSNSASGNTIVKRVNSSSPWTLLGNYVASTGSQPLITKRIGLSGFSQFAIASSVIALPIELTSFTSHCITNAVKLSWTTVSEINNDFFTIERSSDALNWNEIGSVLGAGNSNKVLKYNFIDDGVLQNDVTYYRLKQTDFDGESNFFDIISSNCISNNLSSSIYPNPSSKILNVNFDGKLIKNYTIKNLTGNIVKHEKIQLANYIQINIENLAQGVYYLSIETSKNTIIKKFIKK